MSKYRVLVDDNFHFMDESERYEHGTFTTIEEAIAVCKEIVDSELDDVKKQQNASGRKLLDLYRTLGSDPFVVPVDPSEARVGFSDWDYARERCLPSLEKESSKARATWANPEPE